MFGQYRTPNINSAKSGVAPEGALRATGIAGTSAFTGHHLPTVLGCFVSAHVLRGVSALPLLRLRPRWQGPPRRHTRPWAPPGSELARAQRRSERRSQPRRPAPDPRAASTCCFLAKVKLNEGL